MPHLYYYHSPYLVELISHSIHYSEFLEIKSYVSFSVIGTSVLPLPTITFRRGDQNHY